MRSVDVFGMFRGRAVLEGSLDGRWKFLRRRSSDVVVVVVVDGGGRGVGGSRTADLGCLLALTLSNGGE